MNLPHERVNPGVKTKANSPSNTTFKLIEGSKLSFVTETCSLSGNYLTNYLSVLDHFVRLALKGLKVQSDLHHEYQRKMIPPKVFHDKHFKNQL